MIARIDDKQETSMMVEHQAMREVEQAISIALFLGADRELDSSVTMKSTVSHLFHFNLSLSLSLSLSLTTTKEMVQAPNCSNQRDEDMKLSHTHDTRDTRHERDTDATKQRSNEPIDEGTKNSISRSRAATMTRICERDRTAPRCHRTNPMEAWQ